MSQQSSTGSQDLQHFIRLATAQLKHRLEGVKLDPQNFRRMRILEELLKEQQPHENSRPAAGQTR